jgi:endonuclease VIII
MPEGPEIKLAADRIAKAVVDQPIQQIFFAFEHLKPYEQTLATERIISVRPRGKALLTRFSNQLSIYSHNQLYGLWYVRAAQSYPVTNRQLRLAIHTPQKSALLYSASDIMVLDDTEVAAHPFLRKLGPDVLDDEVTIAQVHDRFTAKLFQRRSFPTLLLDQHFLCGLGNYLRSEILFFARVYPLRRPIDCTPEQIDQLAIGAVTLTRQSYQTKGITNDLAIALALKQAGQTRRSYRHAVFGRTGLPCYRCSTAIVKDMAGGRRVYYCPTCQPAD